jgi:hypothetical protein
MRGRNPPRFCRLRHTLPLLRVSNAAPQRPAYRLMQLKKSPYKANDFSFLFYIFHKNIRTYTTYN